MSDAFSISIFVPSGDPEGLRIIEIPGWTGQGLAFPRALFAERELQEKLPKPPHIGVYILWEPGESEQLPRTYIGQGTIQSRLSEHYRKKDFWTHAIAFTSTDSHLNRATVQYLESKLVQLASEVKRCTLDNDQIPQMPALANADMAYAQSYLTKLLSCLPVLGVNFFEKPREGAAKQYLQLKGKGIEARGFEDTSGFIVRSGSQMVKDDGVAGKIPDRHRIIRDMLIRQGIVEDQGAAYEFTQDYPFRSPSGAASALLGGAVDGTKEWKDARGTPLKRLRETKLPDGPPQ